MLFTPSPPLPSQSISSLIGSESPPTHTVSISNARDVENQLRTDSVLNNITLEVNGSSHNPLLSTSESHCSQLSDPDSFYSPFSTSSSSPPSIQLTPIKTITNIKLSDLHRRDSYPVVPIYKKPDLFHFPRSTTSSIYDVVIAKMSTTNLDKEHIEDLSHLSKTTLWSNNTIIPVANPVAAAALVQDNEMTANQERIRKSRTPSPIHTPKDNERLHHLPTDYAASLFSSDIYTNRKVVLNVGGVRHEGNCFLLEKKISIRFMSFICSFVAYTFSSTKYTPRSFGKIT